MNSASRYINSLYINRLPLPEDCINNIKIYIFTDEQKRQTLIKKTKKEMLHIFEYEAFSRYHSFSLAFDNENIIDNEDEMVEHWVFWAGSNETQFQAVNCKYCGNYISVSNIDLWLKISDNIKCNCVFIE